MQLGCDIANKKTMRHTATGNRSEVAAVGAM